MLVCYGEKMGFTVKVKPSFDRCLAEGQSVIKVINSFNREQTQGKGGKEEKDKNKMKQDKPKTLSPMKKMRLPPGSPTKRIIASPRKRLTVKEIKQTNRYALLANHGNLPDSKKISLHI